MLQLIKIAERKRDILKIIENLDITPTMFNNAVEKYNALAHYLNDNELSADIYPQGSFALGTIIRPNTKDSDASYDLDFICHVHSEKENMSPSELRNRIEYVLKNSGVYRDKLKVFDECFTIQYADINGVSFSIDIVPAVEESTSVKKILISKSNRPDLIETSIAIPKHTGNKNYTWLTNNPRGFKTWFEEINSHFLAVQRAEIRNAIYASHRDTFDSIDEIPSDLERTTLQRVIQIIKFHRNNYYEKLENGDDLKPISAIVNTLAAHIAKNADPSWDVFSLLSFILNELKIYSEHMRIDSNEFDKLYNLRSAITHNNKIWTIQNPANPHDNLADKWNTNSDIPKTFFKWVSICYDDLITSLNLPDIEFRSNLENAFGENIVRNSLGTKYNSAPPKPIYPLYAAKPYRK